MWHMDIHQVWTPSSVFLFPLSYNEKQDLAMPHSTLPLELQRALEIIANTSRATLYACRDSDAWKSVKAVVNSIDNEENPNTDVDSATSTEGVDRSPSFPLASSDSGSVGHSCNSSLVPSSSPVAIPSSLPPVEGSTITENPKLPKQPPRDNYEFLDLVRGGLTKLELLSKKYPILASILLEEKGRPAIDPTIQYLTAVDGNRSPSELEIVLMGLSQLSHASGFCDWEREEKIVPARVDVICSLLSKAPKKNGKMIRYARIKHPEFEDVVSRGIKAGIYKMTFAKLFQRKTEKDIFEGTLAILIFVFKKFRLLTLDLYPDVINLILSEKEPVKDTPDEFAPDEVAPDPLIIDRIEALSPWFADLRSDFARDVVPKKNAGPENAGPENAGPEDASSENAGSEIVSPILACDPMTAMGGGTFDRTPPMNIRDLLTQGHPLNAQDKTTRSHIDNVSNTGGEGNLDYQGGHSSWPTPAPRCTHDDVLPADSFSLSLQSNQAASNPTIYPQHPGASDDMAVGQPRANETNKRPYPVENSNGHQISQRRRLNGGGGGDTSSTSSVLIPYPEGHSDRIVEIDMPEEMTGDDPGGPILPDSRPDQFPEATEHDKNNHRNINLSDKNLSSTIEYPWGGIFNTVEYAWLNEHTCNYPWPEITP
ncbi:uncharacterized protein GIQ15_01998 [Arthroderma uncinatum]|uniref:uncharacterized protein n=1 Tax=Arthroderma uncinatum TaxID=74035 RepID=UPI00144A6A28|nr:uncharacterized protein GIQ15_01998 [Arthroderma uncinatum]KAF3482674.1 hypothetical protein GIQ15_01998 [Arthroderma uncinatum]